MLSHLIIAFALSVSVLCDQLNLYEGSPCNWKGINGTCVNVFRCQSAVQDFKKKNYPPICSFQGKDPVICCTDCDFVEDTRKIIFNKQAGLLYLTGPKAKDKCLGYIDKLEYSCKYNKTATLLKILEPISNCFVVGDIHSGLSPLSQRPVHEDSYMALLGYGDNINTLQWYCAGAIISERFILTAAHCLGSVRFVAVGIVKRANPRQWQKYDVKRAVRHPEYQPPSVYHDIGLVEIEGTINFSQHVLPACLHTEKSADNLAQVIAWSSQDGNTLKLATLTEFDEEQCSLLYPPRQNLEIGIDDTIQSCYGTAEKPSDSCQSDSGGPLVALYHTAGCASVILGVTSINRSCGTAGSSGLYTRVLHYVPWIESIVWP